MTPEKFSDSLGKITEMEKNLVAALKAMLGIYAKVQPGGAQDHCPQRGQGRPRH